MRARLTVLAAILRSPNLRGVLAAFLLFAAGEWATWLAVVVYAYLRGGAAEAGLVAFIQLVPSIVLAPVAANLGDRLPRGIVLLATYLAQAASMAAVTAALVVDAPAPIVIGQATLTATSVTFTRPVHASLLPEVVATPDELTDGRRARRGPHGHRSRSAASIRGRPRSGGLRAPRGARHLLRGSRGRPAGDRRGRCRVPRRGERRRRGRGLGDRGGPRRT